MAIYRYVITADTGMAPAIDDGLVSLATCKPVIRRCAAVGDWVMACRGAQYPEGMVSWVGVVARKLDIGAYERKYRGRADAVYRATEGGGFDRLRPDYHPGNEQLMKDVSNPALLFERDRTWYFGNRPQMLPSNLMHLAPRGQGHRVNGVMPGDEQSLLKWLQGLFPAGIHGTPPEDDGICGACAPSRAAAC